MNVDACPGRIHSANADQKHGDIAAAFLKRAAALSKKFEVTGAFWAKGGLLAIALLQLSQPAQPFLGPNPTVDAGAQRVMPSGLFGIMEGGTATIAEPGETKYDAGDRCGRTLVS